MLTVGRSSASPPTRPRISGPSWPVATPAYRPRPRPRTGPYRQRSLPERPLRDLRGTGRHLRPRMRLHRHDDPILRPGTRTGEGVGRTPDYDPHYGRRPAPRTRPASPNKPTG